MSKPKLHALKTWLKPFADVAAGLKTYEIRQNDRDFAVGDYLLLREYDADTMTYTGRVELASIVHATFGPSWGIPAGLCVLGTRPEGGAELVRMGFDLGRSPSVP